MVAAASTSCTSRPLKGWGSPRTSSKAAHTHFTKWFWASSPSPLGGSLYRLEVVDLFGPHLIVLGWLCYARFMAIPSYAYHELKIPGPTGIITLEAKMQQALDCEQDSNVPAATAVTVAELMELSLRLPTTPLSPVMPPTFGISKMDGNAKAMQIDAGAYPKPCRSEPLWTPNRKVSSSTSFNAIGTCLCGAWQKCRVSLR
jgi:hypothetical protein